MNRKAYFLCVLTLVISPLLAQEFEYQKFISEEASLNYRILYPENFDSAKEYPVLFFLHGAGERGDDNEKQLVHGGALFQGSEFRANFPAVVIFPQCPNEDYWSNARVDRSSLPIDFKYKRKGKATQAMNLAIQLIDSIGALGYSKNNQIYLGGLSMGGMGTFELLARRPDTFAAAFAICGGGNPKNVKEYDNIPLWVFHGAQDNVVLPQYSTRMVLAAQELGMKVRFTLYSDANHNSWDYALAEMDLMPWLFSQVSELSK